MAKRSDTKASAVSKISTKGDKNAASSTGTPGNSVPSTTVSRGSSRSKYGG